MWFHEYFPKSKPRAVTGGIKAQSRTGAFGTTWWAKRWIAVLESFNIGARLGRGRSYARQGQVTEITVKAGSVTAKVQGSRPKPYEVKIEIGVLGQPEWDQVIVELNTQAVFVAKLLNGEMPNEIETVFAKVGLSLFPRSLREIKTACSCPDDSNPCKHIAAVYYLLGEEFDRDPFLLFRLRGTDRETLCTRLSTFEQKSVAIPVAPVQAKKAKVITEPLPADPIVFWATGTPLTEVPGNVQLPSVDAAGPKRLGGFPFWRGTERFLDAIVPIYAAASRRGLSIYEARRAEPDTFSGETK